MLEPNEQAVARLLALGLTNEQIAERLGFRDKRTISRTNGREIHVRPGGWLAATPTKRLPARAGAAIIMATWWLITWDEGGQAFVQSARGEWVHWQP